MQLQQNIALTQRNVKSAYYDMMYAVGNLNVQRQSLELAQQSLKDNRARVEIGTMAPIDIVQAEAEVAQREESLILAEAAISRAEDRLRALVFNPSAPDFWQLRIEPTEPVRVPPDAGGPRSRRRPTPCRSAPTCWRRASSSNRTTSTSATSRTRRCRT